MSKAWIREPGRHFSREHLPANRLGPGARVGIRQKGHGRDLAGTMALLAMLLKNGKDVFVEKWLRERRRNDCRQASEPGKQRIYRGNSGNRNGRSGLPLSP